FINEDNRTADKNTVLANLALLFEPIDGLLLKIYGGVENIENRFDSYRTRNFVNSQGVANVSTSRVRSLLNESTLSYDKVINGRHNISAIIGFTYQGFQSTSLSGNGNG